MVPLTPVSTIVTYTKTSVTTRVDFKSSDHTKRPHNAALCLLCGCLLQGGGQEIPQLWLRPCLTQDTSTPPKMAAPALPCMSSPRGGAKVPPPLEVRDQLMSFGSHMWAWGGGGAELDRVQLEDRTAVTHLCREA